MRRPYPPSFWIKPVLAVLTVALADWLLLEAPVGLNLALAATAGLAVILLGRRAVLRDRLGRLGLLGAAAFVLLCYERPSPLACLFYAALVLGAVLAPRAPRGDDALAWARRLVVAGLKAAPAPLLDLRRLLVVRGRKPRPKALDLALGLVLPVGGGFTFLALFVVANPVLSRLLAGLRLPQIDPDRAVFWAVVFVAVWSALRPRGLRRRPAPQSLQVLELPGVTPTSIALSLAVFNAVFALQNGLDLAFLWSGARLPAGVTLAEYAHRGAYPLIATALLAGLFVLVFLRPGTPAAESRTVRRLVAVWVLQNVFLVASSMLRTLDYVVAYSLTSLRIAALAWMALVAVGLALIGWRLLRGRSAAWLVNANAWTAAVVLAASAVVDFQAVAAAWNVRHAAEAGGRGASLDLCYLHRMGGEAAVPLSELARRPLPPDFARQVRWTRDAAVRDLQQGQAHWRSWTWRGARRLARAEALAGPPATPGRDPCRLQTPPLTAGSGAGS